MKKYLKIFLVILALALVGGWIYWQQYKKSIIRNSIENAVANGTDSLYFIHYDSSYIDEVNGNASFYNVTLQSDSLQRQLALFDTASATVIYNVRIDEVTIKGANIQGLINNTSIEATSILIKHPVVYIIRSGKKEKKLLNSRDSSVIYEKLLGKFKSINAEEIIVEQGQLFFSDKTGEPNTALKDINIELKKFRIDSTRNYDNIVSYFVKDIIAKVKEVYIKGEKNLATFTDVEYNAPEHFIRLKKFQQKNDKGQIVFDVNNTAINNISTNSFIVNQQLQAEELISDGGTLTFYSKLKSKTDTLNSDIEIDNNYFDEALINKVAIGNTKILIYNREKPNEDPFILTNVKFNATDIQKLHSGTNIKNLISSSNWQLSADGFSFMDKDNKYRMHVGAFDINNGNSSMRVQSFTMTPLLSEAAFSQSLKQQDDLYNLDIKNITLTGINTRLLITQKRLEAETATIQPVFKIYRDRTVAENTTSKVGKYPHQLLQKIKFPFSIKKLIIKDGMVSYKEKAKESKQTGTVFFKNINGTINNVTNIPDLISKNNMLVMDATASFMGISSLHSVWKLPLNSKNGAFDISGTAGGFNAPSLNPMIEPLGMASIKAGKVNQLSFNITGTDHTARGTSTLLYDGLKVELLKKDSGDVKKKNFMSMLTNALIKDKNPQNGVIRNGEISYERDVTKSFFNLVWKSLYSGIKKTAQKL
ncbi:MAG: hypothetical protein ABIR78_10685 [Ferruginibacter sp.]